MARPLGGSRAIPCHANLLVPPTLLPLRCVARRVANASEHSRDTKCTSICAAAGSSASAYTPETEATAAVMVPSDTASSEPADLTTIVDISNWFRRTYPSNAYSRALVQAKVERAAAALQAADPSRDGLSLQRDILPKAQLLDALRPGLAGRFFSRYPEEFGHPDAEDYWRIMAALLFTTGFPPEAVSSLFYRHLSLLAWTVRDPENIKALFEWLRGLGFTHAEIMKMVSKNPLLLQTGVESSLKPRLAFVEGLGISHQAALVIYKRHPELLGVDPSALLERIEFLEQECGVTRAEVAKMFVAQPTLFILRTAERLEPAVTFLKEELGCDGQLFHRLITLSGLLTRTPETILARVKVLEDFGIGREGLKDMLRRFPRVLLYPLDKPKYQKKFQFLKEVLKATPQDLICFPQYLSYSLERRTAPRMMAVMALRPGIIPPLPRLAMKLEGFLEYYGLTVEEYSAVVEEWAETEEGKKWLQEE